MSDKSFLYEAKPGSTIEINSIKLIGKSKEEVKDSLNFARKHNIKITLNSANISDLNNQHTQNYLKYQMASLPTKNKYYAHSDSTPMKNGEWVFVGNQDNPNMDCANGSRHNCWDGHQVGRSRKLSPEQEVEVVKNVTNGMHIGSAADVFDCSLNIIKNTMKRYGYELVRTSRFI